MTRLRWACCTAAQTCRKSASALRHGQRAAVAPGGDGLAFDVLHDQEWPAVGTDPAVEQGGDVAVLQAGEDPALAPETGQRGRLIEFEADQLDRDAPLVLVLPAQRLVDRAHAAEADETYHVVGAELLADQGRGVAWRDASGPPRR